MQTIAEALDRLRAMPPTTRPAVMGACPCGCIPTDVRDAFEAVSRTSGPLPATAFYAFKAMTTWGDAEAYRYFLPRILELSLTEEGRGYIGLGWSLIGRKLAMAGVHTWSDPDRHAVLGFFTAVADAHRANVTVDERFDAGHTEDLAYPFVELFVPVHVLDGSLRPVLEPWENRDRLSDWLCYAGLVMHGVPAALRHGDFGGRELREWVWARRSLLDSVVDHWIDEEPAVLYLAQAQDAFVNGWADSVWAFD